jgi:hypothetical protein
VGGATPRRGTVKVSAKAGPCPRLWARSLLTLTTAAINVGLALELRRGWYVTVAEHAVDAPLRECALRTAHREMRPPRGE